MSDNRAYIAPEMISEEVATSPEKKLLIEILNSAVRDILGATSRRDSHRRAALCWLMSDDPDKVYPFSIIRICEELDIDVRAIRRKVYCAILLKTKLAGFSRRTSLPYKSERRLKEKSLSLIKRSTE